MPTTVHPPGCYYINPLTGTIQRQCNPLLAFGLGAAGFVGSDFTPAHGNNAFPTFQAAQAAAAAAAKTLPGGITGGLGGSTTNPVTNALQPLTGLNALGDVAQRLTQGSTWIRVGEVIAGFLLLYMGFNAMTRGPVRSEAQGTVKRAVKTAAKVAK